MRKIIIFLITVLLIWVLLQLYQAVNEDNNNVVLPYYDNTQHEPVKRKLLLIINN